MPSITYPATRREDVRDVLAGVSFPDPYHWLEAETGEVRRWQTDQGDLASRTVRQWAHFDALKANVAELGALPSPSVPRSGGGKWFRIHLPDGATQSVAIVADSMTGEGRVLYDPKVENPEKPPFLSWISPSPDGRILALGVCSDGSENNSIRLVDVASGALLPDPPTELLMDTWTGGAHWLTDSSGFYFTGLSGGAHDFAKRCFFYDVASGAPAREIAVPSTGSGDYHFARPAKGGRWIVAVHRMMDPIPVAVLDLEKGDGAWRPFVTTVEGSLAGHVVGDEYVAVTDVDAPRGRVVAIPLDSATPNDPASWREIVPASDAVIRTVRPVGDLLYVTEFDETYARARIFGLDGRAMGEVPLPGRGTITELPFPMMTSAAPIEDIGFLFGFSSLTASAGLYLHRPGADAVETLIAPAVTIDGAIVEDHMAVSSDGTRIPYHVVRLADATPDRARPALLYAYGGFNAPWSPQFPGAMASIILAGGLFVHCHLRGGSEYGREWWEGGRRKTKQNCYQDLYAIAEQLIGQGVTRSDMLGVTGGSNGGLMSGVVLAQRPELWRVVVPRVPLFDIIGACREPYGRFVCAVEFGDPEDADEVRRMAGFSPYQMIEPGTAYPAVYIDAGDTDPRCPAWHSRKFAALLQASQGGDAPILVHIWENVGHGWATAKDVQIEESTEWLAFVMEQIGLTPGRLSAGRSS